MKETTVLGIKLSVTTKEELLPLVKTCIQQNEKLAFVAINARKVMRAREEQEMHGCWKPLMCSWQTVLP